jgi:hypothetical protein
MLKTSNYRCYHYEFDFSFDDRTDNRSLSLLASISIIQFKNEAKNTTKKIRKEGKRGKGTY